jgi:hypothetical protein
MRSRSRESAAWLSAVLVTLTLSAACTGVSPASGQSRFAQLDARKRACQTGVAGASCRAEAERAFLALADRAAAGAEGARDERARLALMRLTGLAAWQAGPDGVVLATRASEAALPRCRTLDELARFGQVVGAPRDCALLEILPALVWHDGYLRELEALDAAPASAAGQTMLVRITTNYADDTFLLIQEREPRAIAYEGLDASLTAYVATTKRSLFCDFRRVRDAVQRHDRYREALESRVLEEIARGSSAVGLRLTEDCSAAGPVTPPPF